LATDEWSRITDAMEQSRGLTADEVRSRRAQYGPNEIREKRRQPIRVFLSKFWSPVAWMLEASVALELFLHHHTQAAIISCLLIANAAIGFFEEGSAQRALAALRHRLVIRVRALRDGQWKTLPAGELVPGDIIHIRVGDVTPADCRIHEGSLLEDRSVLTGESVPVEVGAGGLTYTGTTVKRGEATAEVLHTGANTFFGKSAEMVRTAAPLAHLEILVVRIAKSLIALDVIVVAAVVVKAAATGLAVAEILPFTLLLLVASVPVALPVTFTLASALGSQQLAARGVLVARLSAIEEAAAMDVICCDKTGTLTENRLSVSAVHPYSPESQEAVLELASHACDPATRDPIDLAVLAAAEKIGRPSHARRSAFVPFDPTTRRSEAVIIREGEEIHILKGAPPILATVAQAPPGLSQDVDDLAASGARVLAVAAGTRDHLRVVGLVGLTDPPRSSSREVIERLRSLGIRAVLVTGDSLPTARAVAGQVAIRGKATTSTSLRKEDFAIGDVRIVAEVFPEDKARIVRALQRGGHVVGMTGDGVNDAPALRQAEVGVAVSRSTDVARAAAGVVLLEEGLPGVVTTVEVGRAIYQRMLTYTLNKIVKTFQSVLFLGGGFILAGILVVSPRQIVLLLFLNDFVTMSLASDRIASLPAKPQRWNLRVMTVYAVATALAWIAFSAIVLVIGHRIFGLDLPKMQTLSFVVLVFTGQATVYLVRVHRHFWKGAPSPPLAASSAFALLATVALATQGWLMAPLSAQQVGAVALAAMLLLFVLDTFKVVVLRRLHEHTVPSGARRGPSSE
jgi:H+-transporting ATPase